jgi:hypothetical protein
LIGIRPEGADGGYRVAANDLTRSAKTTSDEKETKLDAAFHGTLK